LDIKEYILSGVLELYVLGKLDAQESTAVELMAAQHPEIRAEIDAIEQALEVYAQMHGQTPPQGTLGEILNRVDQLRPPNPTTTSGSSPKPPRFLMIFVTIAALVSVMAAVWAFNGKRQTEAQFAQVQLSLDSLRGACDLIARENAANRAELDFLKDIGSHDPNLPNRPNNGTRPIIMVGTPEKDAAAIAAVYVNPQRGKAYLSVVNLPAPLPGKQYQLWVIVGNNPASDMGVFDLPNTPGELKEITFRPEFAGDVTFAVTLEDAGGKPEPDLSQLYMISGAG